MRFTKIFLCFLFLSMPLFSQHAENDTKPVYELIKRVLPAHFSYFDVAFIPTDADGKDIFAIESKNGKILLSGNNGVSIASALNYYLKNTANCQITWNDRQVNLPETLPVPKQKVIRKSPYKFRYYLNYCTFNYTMSWWTWERWQQEIDWMALNGINMPLALTGQNSVWKRVYNQLGFSDKELENFFSGLAYFAWFWMGNLDGWGGPLPQSYMDFQEELQKKILRAERSLGMTPVLPAFTGHVPPAFPKKFPNINTKQTTWVGFPAVTILNPEEEMFAKIGKLFIEEQTRTYGTNHFYTADTFNENVPPTNDSLYLNNISQKVYQSMAAADPKATWIMQGWLFHHNKKFWGQPEIKALLNGVPNDKMIILDLWTERFPVWKETEAYYGKPWIWNMLHNFGQNINLSGWMQSVAENPSKALHDPLAQNMTGIGLTMEGIEQNPVIYELMLENVWRETPVKLDEWLKNYAFRRYGKKNGYAEKAWELLEKSVYSDSLTNGGAESIITGRPTFKKNPGGTTMTKLPYEPQQLIEAWENLLMAVPELKNSDGFRYDLVDVTRQVMANHASEVQQKMAAAYTNNDLKAFNKSARQFLLLLDDFDKLLATRKEFLLGRWIDDARNCGTTAAEKSLYEKNARNLLTLWGDKDCRINDYACRQWAGMVDDFYKQRWSQFIQQVRSDMKQGKEFDQKQFTENMKEWEWTWVNSQKKFDVLPKGDEVKMVQKIHRNLKVQKKY